MGFYDAGFIIEEPKPPPFILWIIAIGSCLLFAASVVLIAIGAVYAYGSIGMTLVGCGAVLYFATVVALVLSCIKVQKRYPGRRLLPSRLIPGRHIRRLSILENPHTSGSAPEKASEGEQHQEPASPPNPQDVHAQEELSPAVRNSGDSTATKATCMVNVYPSDKESAGEEQQKTPQKDSTSSDPDSDELAASATTSDIKNDKIHLHHQNTLPTTQSDSPQKVNDSASTSAISSLANSTLERSQVQYLKEHVPSSQCVTDISSVVPAVVVVSVSQENQDQYQIDTMHSRLAPSMDVREQVEAPSPNIKKPALHQLERASQDMQDTALNSKDCDATPDSSLSCENVTESHCKQDVHSPNVCPIPSLSVEENRISYSLDPSNSKPELLNELIHPHRNAVGIIPRLGEVNTRPADSPPQILQSQSHRQDPYSKDSPAQRSEVFTITLRDSPPTEQNFIYHQCQQQVREDAQPKPQCSVNVVSAAPTAPTNGRKQLLPDTLDQQPPNGPTTDAGGVTRSLNSHPSHEAEVSDLKLQTEHCDDTARSVINYQHLNNTMPPPLPPKRRHSRFPTQTQRLEYVRPTGMYNGESPPAILPVFPPSHRRYLYDHEHDPHHQEVRASTPRTKEPNRELDTSAPSHQCQHQVPEGTPRKAKCSVSFVSAAPTSSTIRRKPIPPDALHKHYPNGPTTTSERMASIMNSYPSREADVSHLKLRPELCDNTKSSKLNFQELNDTVPPPLPTKRRHSSFHAQTPRMEFLYPTDHRTARTAIVPSFPPSHRRYLSDYEQSQHHQMVRASTTCPTEPTRDPDTSAPYYQCQHQIPEDKPPKAECSVSFASAAPPSPTSSRKQIPPDAQDQHHPDSPTTASGGMESNLNSYPSHEAHVSHLKLQPEHSDDTISSVINYQQLNNTMPPPLPAKRRHSSFHTQTQGLEFLRPTDVYYDESTSALVPAFLPSDSRSFSDHDLDEHHQEVSVSTLRLNEPTRELDTSAPSYRKLRTHRSQGRNCKDMPPTPDPCSTEYETANATHDAGSQIMDTLPRHYHSNHHDTSLVNPSYSNYIPSRTVALPRSASTLVLHTSHHPRYLGTLRQTSPSRNFGSSVADTRPGHLRNLSYHRHYHEY